MYIHGRSYLIRVKTPATVAFMTRRMDVKTKSFSCRPSCTMQAIAATSMLRRMIGFRPMMSIKKAFTEKRLEIKLSKI